MNKKQINEVMEKINKSYDCEPLGDCTSFIAFLTEDFSLVLYHPETDIIIPPNDIQSLADISKSVHPHLYKYESDFISTIAKDLNHQFSTSTVKCDFSVVNANLLNAVLAIGMYICILMNNAIEQFEKTHKKALKKIKRRLIFQITGLIIMLIWYYIASRGK